MTKANADDPPAEQPEAPPSGDDGQAPSLGGKAPPDDRASPKTDAAMSTALWSVAGLGGLLSLVGFFAFGGRAAVGVAIGAAIAVANLVVFVRVVRGVLVGGRRGRIWILIGIVKIFALFGGVWLLWRSAWLTPLSLVIGYGAMPLGITLANLLSPRPAGPAEGPSA